MNLHSNMVFEFSQRDFEKDPVFGSKEDFKKIDNIPECGLFLYSDEPLSFIPSLANEDFTIIELPIKGVLDLLAEEAFIIHSERWYKVRKQFSVLNQTHYPWVYVDEETNEVRLMDGRHRLIAMLKLKKMQVVPVQVEPAMVDRVKAHFKI